MSSVTLRPVTPEDHAAWHALWQAYLHFYESELAEEVSLSTGNACST